MKFGIQTEWILLLLIFSLLLKKLNYYNSNGKIKFDKILIILLLLLFWFF